MKLTMTTSPPTEEPTVGFNLLDNLPHLHNLTTVAKLEPLKT
jgi:hypothetical protein